jgi:hypothetical protein
VAEKASASSTSDLRRRGSINARCQFGTEEQIGQSPSYLLFGSVRITAAEAGHCQQAGRPV